MSLSQAPSAKVRAKHINVAINGSIYSTNIRIRLCLSHQAEGACSEPIRELRNIHVVLPYWEWHCTRLYQKRLFVQIRAHNVKIQKVPRVLHVAVNTDMNFLLNRLRKPIQPPPTASTCQYGTPSIKKGPNGGSHTVVWALICPSSPQLPLWRRTGARDRSWAPTGMFFSFFTGFSYFY